MACAQLSELNSEQKDMAAKIIYAGTQRNFSPSMIEFAVRAAFIESSLGLNIGPSRPGGDHIGLYQYDAETWDTQGHVGNRTDYVAQINAFYDDITYYVGRYSNLTPYQRSIVSLEKYIYIKHHDGRSFTDLENAPGGAIYDSICIDIYINSYYGYSGGGVTRDYYVTTFGYVWGNLPIGLVTVSPIYPAPDPPDDRDEQ